MKTLKETIKMKYIRTDLIKELKICPHIEIRGIEFDKESNEVKKCCEYHEQLTIYCKKCGRIQLTILIN